MSETDSGADTVRAIHPVRRLVAALLLVLLPALTAGPVTAIVLDLTLVEMIHLELHDMGPGLAESIDEVGSGASVWMTKELWGVGSTAPYLHDGRATTLTEAILEHGGEAAPSRQAFEGLSATRQADLIAFLESLVLFKIEEEE